MLSRKRMGVCCIMRPTTRQHLYQSHTHDLFTTANKTHSHDARREGHACGRKETARIREGGKALVAAEQEKDVEQCEYLAAGLPDCDFLEISRQEYVVLLRARAGPKEGGDSTPVGICAHQRHFPQSTFSSRTQESQNSCGKILVETSTRLPIIELGVYCYRSKSQNQSPWILKDRPMAAFDADSFVRFEIVARNIVMPYALH